MRFPAGGSPVRGSGRNAAARAAPSARPRLAGAPARRGACEMLRLDPFHVANEGKLVAFVPEDGADRALSAPHP